MDFNATIDLIVKDLEEARRIIDDLKRYPGVPTLQVELAKSKCKSAAEVIALLKDLSNNVPIVKEEKKPVGQQKAMPVQEEIKPVSIKSKISHPQVEKEGKNSESAILADKYSQSSVGLNEQFGILKTENDLSEKLKTKPITSLSEAIGVNDKFLFMSEIFNGNKDAYTQAISRLENAETLSDARAVIMSYTGDSNENEVVKQLLDLVKRKLTPNE